MMKIETIKKINLDTLHDLVDFLINCDSIKKIVEIVGPISHDNGYGTCFLSPKNKLFEFFWLYQNNQNVEAIGFGGKHLGITVSELFSDYDGLNESFSRYDDEYIYVFFKSSSPYYTIKITSKSKIFDNGKLLKDCNVDSIEISLIV